MLTLSRRRAPYRQTLHNIYIWWWLCQKCANFYIIYIQLLTLSSTFWAATRSLSAKAGCGKSRGRSSMRASIFAAFFVMEIWEEKYISIINYGTNLLFKLCSINFWKQSKLTKLSSSQVSYLKILLLRDQKLCRAKSKYVLIVVTIIIIIMTIITIFPLLLLLLN